MAQATRLNTKSKQNEVSGAVGFRLREAALILSLALAGYLLLSLFTYNPTDPGWSTTGLDDIVSNSGGIVGAWLADALLYGFGFPAYLSPLMLAFSGWLLFSWGKTADSDSALHFWVLKATGLIMALSAASGLSTLSLLAYAGNLPLGAGGVLGEVVGNGFVAIFGTAGSSLLLLAVLLTGVTLFTGLSWLMVIDRLGGFVILVVTLVSRWLREFKEKLAANRTKQQREDNFNEQNEKLQLRSKVRVEPTIQTTEVSKREEKERQVPLFETVEEGVMPALALLEQAEASKGGYSEEVLQALSRQVELKLKDFGVTVQVVEVQPGPVVTRFELQPAAGIKVSRISGLAKDLARALSVSSVRVVEVIPGKPVVGLEIPNEQRDMVRLREILG
ncbi:MAG: DNA translocase FtsK 4TM domain-containing protein, partial [Proteobacteria bacterium]|nr:DNA translocase FtsK 4TM domain-containing protein [Pseudomonadota bacterium]